MNRSNDDIVRDKVHKSIIIFCKNETLWRSIFRSIVTLRIPVYFNVFIPSHISIYSSKVRKIRATVNVFSPRCSVQYPLQLGGQPRDLTMTTMSHSSYAHPWRVILLFRLRFMGFLVGVLFTCKWCVTTIRFDASYADIDQSWSNRCGLEMNWYRLNKKQRLMRKPHELFRGLRH